jgi:methionyl-tRNA synthetase
MKKKFYISTAIAYSSKIPHIGNVYEVILTDAIARFKRLDGYDVYFQTGTDEHGQKIEELALKQGLSPKQYVDIVSNQIKDIYDSIDISYDKFVRTTDPFHLESVSKIYDKLFKNKDIYLGKYEGWYSVADESFVKEEDIKDGLTPFGDKAVWVSEDAYFLNLATYQKKLVEYIKNNPSFISPESRKKEMLNNFLKTKLVDLCVSRSSFSWGVPLGFAAGHVSYVWIDALSNYITGLGYSPDLKPKDMPQMSKYWPCDVHIIGKDILRFHTIYWPVILMALGLPLPKKIFGHPWVLTKEEKMSKTKGNVIYTTDLIKYFGVDPVRYFCLHEIPYKEDGNLTYQLVIERNNTDLANTIGNLLNRTLGMIKKYQNNVVKRSYLKEPFELDLKTTAAELLPKIRISINEYNVSSALEEIVNFARIGNKYIEISAPWALVKTEGNENKVNHILNVLTESLRFISILLQPFMPSTAKEMATQLLITDMSFKSLSKFFSYSVKQFDYSKPIFVRYDVVEKLKEIEEQSNEQ